MAENIGMMMTPLKPKTACEILHRHGYDITPVKLGYGLQQGVFPFGLAIKCAKEWDYVLYRKLLMDWIAERSEKVEEEPR